MKKQPTALVVLSCVGLDEVDTNNLRQKTNEYLAIFAEKIEVIETSSMKIETREERQVATDAAENLQAGAFDIVIFIGNKAVLLVQQAIADPPVVFFEGSNVQLEISYGGPLLLNLVYGIANDQKIPVIDLTPLTIT